VLDTMASPPVTVTVEVNAASIREVEQTQVTKAFADYPNAAFVDVKNPRTHRRYFKFGAYSILGRKWQSDVRA